MRIYLSLLLFIGLAFWGCEDSESQNILESQSISDDFRRCAVISETIMNPYQSESPMPTITWNGRICTQVMQMYETWFDTVIYHYDNYGNLIKRDDSKNQSSSSDSTIYNYIDYWKMTSRIKYSNGNPYDTLNNTWNGLTLIDANCEIVYNKYGRILLVDDFCGGHISTYLEDGRRIASRTWGVTTEEYTWEGLDYEMLKTINVMDTLFQTTYYGRVNEYGYDVESAHASEDRYIITDYDCEIFDPIPIE